VLAGVLAGYAVHAVSLLVTNGVQHLRELLPALGDYFSSWRARWEYFADNPMVMGMLAVNSVVEEILYRAAAQSLLIEATGRPWACILLVAILFSAAHQHFLRGPLLEGVEFLAYAVLLGALYYATGSLVFVMVIHTVRNFELYYQQFLIEKEKAEAGGAESPPPGGAPLEHA
jgi:membrane protease YdiL (CAAX protease family)